MSSKFYGSPFHAYKTPGFATSATWVDESTHVPLVHKPQSDRQMIDELNRRLVDLEIKISAYASKVQTLETNNGALTEMVEYLKDVANDNI